ncbi:MAG: FKBP-type peptidyl-prolyl cis-trans isomerase [Prevotella sp.]|nr:FKBP-type peptidyl-prolyl cis-trans isomerase [Prevotella sp.]
MKVFKYIFALMMLPLAVAVSSCSEDSNEVDEFENWEERNNAAITQWSNNSALRKIKSYTKDQMTGGTSSDYIYVEVLESGSETETESPLFSDNVWVAYRGRYIPTVSYPEGYIFDQSYEGEFDWRTADMIEFSVSGVVTGFSTALMQMHRGDRWRVYIPYHLGYGTSSSTSIRGYSNLIFDIALLDFWHPNEDHPISFKARE